MPGLELHPSAPAPTPIEPPGRAAPHPTRQQSFPFMQLPTEVRFMIYEIALQQTIDHAISQPFGTPRLLPAKARKKPKWNPNTNTWFFWFCKSRIKTPPLIGVLAFLRTNRKLRSEFADELVRLIRNHVKALCDHSNTLYHRTSDGDRVFPTGWFSRLPLFKTELERGIQYLSEYREARMDVKMVGRMFVLACYVKHGIMRIDLSDLEFRTRMQKVRDLQKEVVLLPVE